MTKPRFRSQVYGPASTSIVFLFCPYGIPRWQMALPIAPIHRLVQAGHQVVAYDYPLSIVSVNHDITIPTIEAMLANAHDRIAQLPATANISAFGSSLGTAFAASLAAQEPRIQRLVLNLSYGDITDHVINLPRLIYVPPKRAQGFIAHAGGPEGLHRLFDRYSPLHLAPKLEGKDILLYLEQHDRIQQFQHTRTLPDVFRHAGAHVTYIETHVHSHYLAAFVNHLRAKRYLKFLRS